MIFVLVCVFLRSPSPVPHHLTTTVAATSNISSDVVVIVPFLISEWVRVLGIVRVIAEVHTVLELELLLVRVVDRRSDHVGQS